MKKSANKTGWIIAVVVVIILIVGGYYYFKAPSVDYNYTPQSSINYVKTLDSNSALGTVLTDESGKVLYTRKGDNGSSGCYDACAAKWPPFIISGNLESKDNLPGTLGLTTRTDGMKQATYDGMPLYYYSLDNSPGVMAGQGIGGIWFVVTVIPANINITPTKVENAKTHYINISNYAFVPDNITINRGDSVEWINTDYVSHTIVSDSGIFKSGFIINQGIYDYPFYSTGTFDYHCGVHTSMKATIRVV